MADQGRELAGVVYRNIRALLEVRRQQERARGWSERLADAVTAFTGSMASVALHGLLVVAWIAVNSGLVAGVTPFDPFPFVMLAMIASVEAIFLSTFVLISQNRLQVQSERRAELELQISLLAEHEVTRLIELTDAVARRLGVALDRPLDELEQDVLPEDVLEAIRRAEDDVSDP